LEYLLFSIGLALNVGLLVCESHGCQLLQLVPVSLGGWQGWDWVTGLGILKAS
jgi:hypothetical protein